MSATTVTINDLTVFVSSVTRYFKKTTREEAEVSVPYPESGGVGATVLDFTGVVAVSGKLHGGVYFTAGVDLLFDLLQSAGEPQVNLKMAADAVGEVANVIAGNARKHFGADFKISVPTVFQGTAIQKHTGQIPRRFVIPLIWRGHRSYVVVGLN